MTKRHNGEGSIYVYRNGFAAHVWITTPEGRRQRKVVYGKTREQVHTKWLALHELARRGPVAPSSPVLADFMERWLREVVVPNLAPTTSANYELFTRLYVVPDLGRKRVDKLTVREVQTWLNELRVRCQCCAQGKDAARAEARCCAAGNCCHQIGSEWTVHQAWTVLRSALSAAMRDELVTRNVAGLVRLPVPRTKKLAIWSLPVVTTTRCTRATSSCSSSGYGAASCSDWPGTTSTLLQERRTSPGSCRGSRVSSSEGLRRRCRQKPRYRCRTSAPGLSHSAR